MLSKGSSGTSVTQLQNALNNKIYWAPTDKKLVADGQFGPLTESAVKLYQAQNNLPITGIADTITLNKLGITSIAKTTAPKVTLPVVNVPSKTGFSMKNIPTSYYIAGGVLAIGILFLLSNRSAPPQLDISE